MNIEFGCGETATKPGYLTCDIRDLPGIDFVCPAWEIENHVSNNTVDNIFSRHFFEHLTFRQGRVVLEQWLNILKPGGLMEMMLPNMSFHIRQWTEGENMEHAKAGFWGWQRGDFEDVWDVHKSGYTLQTLEEVLNETGYEKVTSLHPPTSKHLYVRTYKPLG